MSSSSLHYTKRVQTAITNNNGYQNKRSTVQTIQHEIILTFASAIPENNDGIHIVCII